MSQVLRAPRLVTFSAFFLRNRQSAASISIEREPTLETKMTVPPTINARKKIAQFLPLTPVPKKRRPPQIEDAAVPSLRFKYWREKIGVADLVAQYSGATAATVRRIVNGQQQTHV